MLFNSSEFVVFFLLVCFLYAVFRSSWPARKVLLAVSSYVFYMSWSAPFALLLVGSTILDFTAGLRISQSDDPRIRRAWLIASCAGNLGVLAFFKYGGFIAENIWAPLPFGGEVPDFIKYIVLPVGISFYTFQSMSYTIDVYRNRDAAEKSFLNFALYVSFFPQLVAGPILRASEFLPQLQSNRRTTAGDALVSIDLIVRGFAKKILIADQLAKHVDVVFAHPEDFGTLNVLLATYAYAFQIYFDFSGYTDIAIGTARLLGFNVPRNFNLPYLARNPSEFWRRWHISLSTWLRDYLYISLGGSRSSAMGTYRNLLITMILGGLWHGAAWGFIVWGLFHGLLLVVHRFIFRDRNRPFVPAFVSISLMFHLTCLGWIFFRATSLSDAFILIRQLFDFETPVYRVQSDLMVLLCIGFVSHFLGAIKLLQKAWADAHFVIKALYYAGVIAAIYLYPPSENANFIYFQF